MAKSMLWAVLLLVQAMVFSSGVLAVTRTWTGQGDGRRWADPANWSGNTLPQTGDDVLLSTDFSTPVVVDQPVSGINLLTSYGLLEVHPGGELSVTTGRVIGGVVRVAGGTVRGGTWSFTGATSAFEAASNVESTFDGVVTAGRLLCNKPNARVRLRNDPRFGQSVIVSQPGVTICVPAGETVHWTVTSAGQGPINPPLAIEAESDGIITVGEGGAWGSATGVHIGTNRAYPGRMTLINRGTVGGGYSRLVPHAFENFGTVTGVATFRLEPQTDWTNRGLITIGGVNDSQIRGRWVNEGVITGPACSSGGTGAPGLALQGEWINRGEIRGCMAFEGVWRNEGLVAFGSIHLRGNVLASQLGEFESLAVIAGTLDNTGAVTNLRGGWFLGGGQLFGGTLIAPPANWTSMTGILRDIAISGEMDLDGLTIGPNVSCTRARLRGGQCLIADGTTIDFPIDIQGPQPETNPRLAAVPAGGSITLGPGCEIFSSRPNSAQLRISAGNLVNVGSVFARDGLMVDFLVASMRNEGTLLASGRQLRVFSAGQFTNDGSMQADGAALTVESLAWTTSRPIMIRNAPMSVFKGQVQAATLDHFDKDASPIEIQGVVLNEGRTLQASATTGDLGFSDCVINGGSIRMQGASRLRFGPMLVTVVGSSFDGPVIADRPAAIRLRSGAVVSSVQCSAPFRIYFAPGQVWDFPITGNPGMSDLSLEIDAGVTAFQATSQASITAISADDTLINWIARAAVTFSSDATVDMRGTGRFQFTSGGILRQNAPLRFEGAIDVNLINVRGSLPGFSFAGPGGRLGLAGDPAQGATFERVDVPSGTACELSGKWACTGPIVMGGSTVTLGGFFHASSLAGLSRGSGELRLSGDMDLGGGTFTVSQATGSITCANGTIRNGVLRQADGQRLRPLDSAYLVLRGVRAEYDALLNERGCSLFLLEGSRAASVRLTGANSFLVVSPNGVIDYPVVMEAQSSVSSNGTGSVRIAPGGSIEARNAIATLGSRSGSMTLTVEGACIASGPGARLTLNPGTLVNYDPATRRLRGGSWRAMNGGTIDLAMTTGVHVNDADVTLDGISGGGGDFASLNTNIGRLRLSGRRHLQVASSPAGFTNLGTLEIGAGSILTVGIPEITSFFSQGPTGRLLCEASGSTTETTMGQVRVFGPANLDGEFRATFLAPFEPACGSAWWPVDAADPPAGRFALDSSPFPSRTTVLAVNIEDADVVARVAPLADFDRSGFVDFFDYGAFVDCFEGGNCGRAGNADVNRDDFLDFFDYLDFVASFETGC